MVQILQRARSKWGQLSYLFGYEGLETRTSGVFYVTVVQPVLIFGSESWVVTPRILRALESLHHQVARQISGWMPLANEKVEM